MQISLLDILPNAAGDSPAARPGDKDGHDSVCPFSVQMDKVCSPEQKAGSVRPSDRPVKQSSTPPAHEKQNQPPVFCHLRPESFPAKITPGTNPEDSASLPLEKHCSIDSDVPGAPEIMTASGLPVSGETAGSPANASAYLQAETVGEGSTRKDDYFPARRGIAPETDTRNVPGTMSKADSGAGKNNIETKNVLNAGSSENQVHTVTASISLDPSHKLSGWDLKADVAQTLSHSQPEFRVLGNTTLSPELQPQSHPEGPGFPHGFAEIRNSGLQGENARAALPGKPEASGVWKIMVDTLESTQSEVVDSLAMSSFLRPGLPVQPEVNLMSEKLDPAGDISAARGAPAKGHNLQADTAKMLQDYPFAAPEKTNAGDSNAGQDSRSGNSKAWSAFPSKGDGLELTPSRPQAFVNRQLDIPAPSSFGTVRAPDSGLPQTSGSGMHSEARAGDFFSQLAEQIQVQFRGGKGEIRIQLKPESLGRLEIRAETTSEGVIARIAAESSNVKNYLENNLSYLHQALHNQGFRVDRIHIVIQGGFDGQSLSDLTSQFDHAGSGRNESETTGNAKTSGLLAQNQQEESAVDPASWITLNPNISFHTIA